MIPEDLFLSPKPSSELPSRRRRLPARLALGAGILLLTRLLTGCSEDDDPIRSFNLVGEVTDSTGLRSLAIGNSDLDTYFQTTRNTGTRFWAGREQEVGTIAEAKGFVRFLVALPSGATIVADTVRLQIDAGGDYGHATSQVLAIERVNADDWYTDDTQGWPFSAHTPLSPPTSITVGAANDSTSTPFNFTLPVSLVQSWAANPDSNFGLAMVARSGSGWKRFLAVGPLAPVLALRYAVGVDTQTVRLPATHAATLTSFGLDIENGTTGDEPFALVGGPFDYRALVRFDLSTVPALANVHRLRIELPLDPAQEFTGETSTEVTVGAYAVVTLPGEELGPRPVVGFVSTPIATTTIDTATDSVLVLEVSGLGRQFERGILLKVARDYPSLVRFGIGTREGPAARNPRLSLTYSLPARIRL
jgi:hypothetical protein